MILYNYQKQFLQKIYLENGNLIKFKNKLNNKINNNKLNIKKKNKLNIKFK